MALRFWWAGVFNKFMFGEGFFDERVVEGSASPVAAASVTASTGRVRIGNTLPSSAAQASVIARAARGATGTASAVARFAVSAMGHRAGATLIEVVAMAMSLGLRRVFGEDQTPPGEASLAAQAFRVRSAPILAEGNGLVAAAVSRLAALSASQLAQASLLARGAYRTAGSGEMGMSAVLAAVSAMLRGGQSLVDTTTRLQVLPAAALASRASFAGALMFDADGFLFGWRSVPGVGPAWSPVAEPGTAWVPVDGTAAPWTPARLAATSWAHSPQTWNTNWNEVN